MNRPIRNIAIIAHVDHGKTTLVDQLLQQSGTFAAHENVRASASWTPTTSSASAASPSSPRTAPSSTAARASTSSTRPGHADFGGEVERVLSMVDGVLLLVDAVEGPMPQTRFVTRKALALGLKADRRRQQDRPRRARVRTRSSTRPSTCSTSSAPPTQQLDFPVVYASALQRLGQHRPHRAPPGHDARCSRRSSARAAAARRAPRRRCSCRSRRSTTTRYVGRIGIGRIRRGTVRPGENVALRYGNRGPGQSPGSARSSTFAGLERRPVEEASAGDIVPSPASRRSTSASP